MITFTTGNLLEADVDALVNTVNTVGVMGKGIALMFKEAFPDNTKAYEAAAKRGAIQVGRMFVTERNELLGGPKWIINFPTKKDWKHRSKLEWIEQGLTDLVAVIKSKNIRSIAIPPLGSGNGGLDWRDVRWRIERTLEPLADVAVVIYEPIDKYQNVAKKVGVEKLTPPRALIAEMIRRYWVLGFECSLLEVQKLAYFIERNIISAQLDNKMNLQFKANRYGPYAPRLMHLLNGLDGSYLHCDKRLSDAGPMDAIYFEESKKDTVSAYLGSGEAKPYGKALEATAELIDGFQSPLGMELLATVDWLLHHEKVEPTVESVRAGLLAWPGGHKAGERKARLFDNRLIDIALRRLTEARDPV